MSLNDFYLGRYLGKGSFGSVQIVQRKSDNKYYAMKRVAISKLPEKDKQNALNEIRILASLNHKNIIGYKESFYDEASQTLNLIMEYADDGDISLKIKNNLKRKLIFEENTIWNWIIQLLEGIQYLHDNKVMHRDLKSANLFLLKNGTLKIGDLNVSTVAKNGLAYTQTGTPYYAPPEIWKDKPYNYKCDIWSAGCIIYEICTLHVPFRGTNFKDLYNNITKGEYIDIGNNYSNDLKNLLKMMLIVNPDKRYNVKQILNSEIIKKKMKEINFNEEVCDNGGKALLMKTIKLPKNMSEINNNLPKKYLEKSLREEEMMKNDEYETVKQSFYKSIIESQKNKENNLISNNNNINNIYNTPNGNINNNSNNNNNNHNISNNLIGMKSKNSFNIKNDYYNKTKNNNIQGNEESNPQKYNNIIDYNTKRITMKNSVQSHEETSDNTKISENIKTNSNLEKSELNLINQPIYKDNLNNSKRNNESNQLNNGNNLEKKININQQILSPNNINQKIITSNQNNPIKIKRGGSSNNNEHQIYSEPLSQVRKVESYNKKTDNSPLSQIEKNNHQIKMNALPIQNKPQISSNKRNQNNLLNYAPNRPNSVGGEYHYLGNYNNININNNNYLHNNMNIYSNKNYINEYIEKERQINEKKKELNEINKNIKLLDFRQNNISNRPESYKIKRGPSNYINPNLYNKGNNNINFPIFHYKKININPNRKIAYGKVEYKREEKERQYYNIPVKLKYQFNNNYNHQHINNNNNYNNNNKYVIENINNHNYGIRNKFTRDGPRVIIRNALK